MRTGHGTSSIGTKDWLGANQNLTLRCYTKNDEAWHTRLYSPLFVTTANAEKEIGMRNCVKHGEMPSYQEGYDFPWVTAVKPLANYRIHIRYSDGVEGEIDLSDCVGTELFADWQEPGMFEKVQIGDYGEVWWSDMASLCPDSLYLELTGKKFEEVSLNHQHENHPTP